MKPDFINYKACGKEVTRPVLFRSMQTVCTKAAADLLKFSDVNPQEVLLMHQAGCWGDVCKKDRAMNNRGLITGAMLMSTFRFSSDILIVKKSFAQRSQVPTLLVITEAAMDSSKPLDRHTTMILCREEY
jgi:hypothetical protein